MNNPIVRLKKGETIQYPITVYCVVEDLSYKNDENLKLKAYVHSLNITFITREFNSVTNSDDRHNIYRLPAFHIYDRVCYKQTFYLNTLPYQIIHDVLDDYKTRISIKEANKKAWKKFFSNIILSLKKLTFKKKPQGSKILDWP